METRETRFIKFKESYYLFVHLFLFVPWGQLVVTRAEYVNTPKDTT